MFPGKSPPALCSIRIDIFLSVCYFLIFSGALLPFREAAVGFNSVVSKILS